MKIEFNYIQRYFYEPYNLTKTADGIELENLKKDKSNKEYPSQISIRSELPFLRNFNIYEIEIEKC